MNSIDGPLPKFSQEQFSEYINAYGHFCLFDKKQEACSLCWCYRNSVRSPLPSSSCPSADRCTLSYRNGFRGPQPVLSVQSVCHLHRSNIKTGISTEILSLSILKENRVFWLIAPHSYLLVKNKHLSLALLGGFVYFESGELALKFGVWSCWAQLFWIACVVLTAVDSCSSRINSEFNWWLWLNSCP